MARVVCRVHRSEEQLRASLTWSEGPDEFPRYHFDGQLYRALEDAARKVREQLGHVVRDFVDERTSDDARRRSAYELAAAGFELYQQLFWPVPEDQTQADDVRQWLTQLRDRDEIESLELVVDSPWSVAWNAVYDQPPDERAFLENPPDGAQWEPFWGFRYRLAASRGGGSPLRRTAVLDAPSVLLVGDASDPYLADDIGALRAFAAEHDLPFVDCLADLQRQLQQQRPDLLYWLSHAEPAALVLGNDEITANVLLRLLRKPGALSGLAFLNCCGTAVEHDTGSFLDALRNVGFSGLIGTEQITYSTVASRFGLEFLRAFLIDGQPAAETLRRLRRQAAPLGLVYGTYCPPLLHVQTATDGEPTVVSEPAVAAEPSPAPAVPLGLAEAMPPDLPDEPYRGLAYFERRDRALFAGRAADVVRCAELLDRDDTRFLLLHGESGVGKSSFLRAGLIPYLEEERVGYRMLRRRRAAASELVADESASDSESALFVRCTNDPFGQLAEALSDFCAHPLTYRTPDAAEQVVDLPRALADVAGTVQASQLRQALHADPRLLGRVLAHLGRKLPFRLVTIIDQGEELYTLSRAEAELETRRRALEMLRGALDVAGDFKLILTLRTEYLGRLADALRRGQSDVAKIGECLLSNLSAEAIQAAIVAPTHFAKWRFSYAPGVAEEIAGRAVAFQEDQDASILPLVQVVCQQLYEALRDRPSREITLQDFAATGGIDGALQRYVDERLQTSVRQQRLVVGDRLGLCRLFDQLHVQRPDGTTATALVAETTAAATWTGSSDFQPVLQTLLAHRLVRRNRLRIGDTPATYLSLGHDRLVDPLLEWSKRERKATRRGRAEQRLAERSAFWSAKPDSRHLPSWWETLSIELLTGRRDWTESQRAMMRVAQRRFVGQLAAACAVAVALLCGLWVFNGYLHARDVLQALPPDLGREIDEQRSLPGFWARHFLQGVLDETATGQADRRRQLHARLALLPHQPDYIPKLLDDLLGADVPYVQPLRDGLRPYYGQRQVADRLWQTLHNPTGSSEARLRAGLALALYEPSSKNWTDADRQFLVQELVAFNPEHQPKLREYLQPLAESLLTDLERVYVDRQATESQQVSAANALADFARDDIPRLTQLTTVATAAEYAVLYPRIRDTRDSATTENLRQLAAQQPPEALPAIDRVALGKRRAGAAITLLRLGRREASLEALRVADDPESLTQFVHRCRAREVTLQQVLECLRIADAERQTKQGADRQLADRVVFGLLLAIGEFELAELAEAEHQPLADQLIDWYRNDPSSRIHGASGWLLRQWKFEEAARKVDQTPVPYSPQREWFTLGIKSTQRRFGIMATDWTSYMTFVVFPAGQYVIGSPTDEPRRSPGEDQYSVRITRPFAISESEVTWAQFSGLDNGERHDALQRQLSQTLSPNEPAFGMSWFEAVNYCRWLTGQQGLSEDDQCYGPEPLDADTDSRPAYVELPFSADWPVRLDRPGFRLPTEAEWEIACRAGSVTAYAFGGDPNLVAHYAWFHDNSTRSQVVRQLRPNLRGVFDMHGNVEEWCHDRYGAYPRGILAMVHGTQDWHGPPRGLTGKIAWSRVYRGGTWDSAAAVCRSASRNGYLPTFRSTVGFRVALVPSEKPGE